MRNFETESPLQIEKEDHAILNGLPLSFSPPSCDLKRYGRSSMASLHMVAFFEVADSVRVCPSKLQMQLLYSSKEIRYEAWCEFVFQVWSKVCHCSFLFLAAFLCKISSCDFWPRPCRVADAGAKLTFLCKCPE